MLLPHTRKITTYKLLRFKTLTTNLLIIPYIVGRTINTLLVTLVSEAVNERSFVCMMQNVWILPFLIGIYTLPKKPDQWVYFVCALSSSWI